MITASCHCGTVRLELPSAPTEVTDCTCSICRRYGVLWAYYPADEVRITASTPTQTYAWGKESIAFNRCAKCGCVSHWARLHPTERNRMGVNARLLDSDVLAKARVRHLDGARTEKYLD